MSATDDTSLPPIPGAPAAPVESPVAPAAPVAERTETERLDPQPVVLALTSGTQIDIEPLKLRQFLRLLRILTRGASGVLDSVQLSSDMDAEVFTQQLIAMVLLAIPEAEDETVDFIRAMVKPKGHPTGNSVADAQALTSLYSELENPELEDVITVVEAIVTRESGDLRALGKRLGSMLETARKMGATKG